MIARMAGKVPPAGSKQLGPSRSTRPLAKKQQDRVGQRYDAGHKRCGVVH